MLLHFHNHHLVFNGLYYTHLSPSSPIFSIISFPEVWVFRIWLICFPQNIFLFTKISSDNGNHQESLKCVLLFLYLTYSRVATNDQRDYIRITSRAEERATVIHFFPFSASWRRGGAGGTQSLKSHLDCCSFDVGPDGCGIILKWRRCEDLSSLCKP